MTDDYVPPTFSEHFEIASPEVLYHYTGQAGLLGIIERKELWCTKVQYMNDSTEFGLALDMARTRLKALIAETPDDGAYIKRRLDCHEFLRSLDGLEEINLFAVCFCKDGDLLSQWRGYAGGGPGYAIGFDTAELKQATVTEGFILSKCIYEPDVQRKIIDEAVDFCLQEAAKSTVNWGFHGPLASVLFRYGAFFKDPSFKEEHEWRLISPTIMFHNEQLGFRTGRSMITPYYRLSIAPQDRLPITHVVVGPCPHMELSKSSVTALLMANGLRGLLAGLRVAIPSKIPFRDW
jgi:hypothetical protein